MIKWYMNRKASFLRKPEERRYEHFQFRLEERHARNWWFVADVDVDGFLMIFR